MPLRGKEGGNMLWVGCSGQARLALNVPIVKRGVG